MPFTRALAYAVYTLWVSVCAFAPELLWQGFVLLRGHFGTAELFSALFIGTLFAFFVEPLVERFKAGRWRLAHAPSGGMLLGVLVSLVFGIVVVCIHEAMIAYLGAEHAGDGAKQASLARAIDSASEWASIPAAVTAAWFVAGTSRRLALPATGLACVWIVVVGHAYGWGWPIVATSAVPGFLIALLGSRVVLRHWDAKTIPELAQLTAWVAGGWMLLAWGIQAGSGMIESPGFQIYTPEAFYEDLRFYLGWCLGLLVAPNPVPDDASKTVVHPEATRGSGSNPVAPPHGPDEEKASESVASKAFSSPLPSDRLAETASAQAAFSDAATASSVAASGWFILRRCAAMSIRAVRSAGWRAVNWLKSRRSST